MRTLAMCLIFCLKISIVWGQFDDKISVTLPSPNSMGDQATPFNYYHGTPGISLPLYTLESSELKVPIAIGYRATGVKLHYYASTVGINWNLQAGGSITRVVRGRPDESDSGYIGANRTGLNINGGNEVDAARTAKINSGEWDGEPDLYFITTPFESNSFVFDENKEIVFTRPTRMKLAMQPPAGTNNYTNVTWGAIDENGNRYVFGATNSSKEIVQGDISYVSTWLLNEVTTYNRTDKLTFEYMAGQNIAADKFVKTKLLISASGACSGGSEEIWDNANTVTYTAPKYLSKISCNSGRVEFIYVDDRRDQVGAKRLVHIDVYNNTSFLKRLKFRHHYFGTPDADIDLNRLALQDVYVIGEDNVSSIKLYEFKYFNNPVNKFPSRSSASIDHWGYYNINSYYTPFPPEATKDAHLERTKQYTLSEIEYGLGGKTAYEYELNDYWDATTSTTKPAGGLRVKSITETDNTGETFVRTFNYRVEGSTTRSSGEPYIQTLVYEHLITEFLYGNPGCTRYGETFYSTLFFTAFDVNEPYVGY